MNKYLEYIYFYISKNMTSYTFVAFFRFLLKHTNSKMIRKILRLNSGQNLLPAHKSGYDLTP